MRVAYFRHKKQLDAFKMVIQWHLLDETIIH